MISRLYSVFLCGLIFIFISSCSTEKKQEPEAPHNDVQDSNSQEPFSNDGEETENENIDPSETGCKFEDGTYSATVEYYNPETGYSNTYTLDVEVQNCQVVQINFPSGGYLDEDHITAVELDESGHATVDGEEGKTYEVQID
jgi:hypothetical protein